MKIFTNKNTTVSLVLQDMKHYRNCIYSLYNMFTVIIIDGLSCVWKKKCEQQCFETILTV